MTVTLLVVAGASALLDWIAVARRLFRVEYLFKPLTLALLIWFAASADVPLVKGWVLAGLAFGLLGDIGLMLSDATARRPDAAFLLGLASFLAGHVCYLAAFARYGISGLHLLAGVLVVGGVAVLSLPSILRGARLVGGVELMAIVAAYATMLAAMAALAVGTGKIATAVGGVLFLVSDTALGHERFVRRLPHGPLLVIATYHLAQGLIVLGLASSL